MGNEMMYTVFKSLNNMFLDKTKLSLRSSFNPEAGDLYFTSIPQFMKKVIESIQDSQLSLTQNDPKSSMIIDYSHMEQRIEIKE